MTSNLHKLLQTKALHYLRDKGYWIKAIEMPTSSGIIDAWGISNSSFPKYDTAAIEVKVSRNDYKSRSQKYKELVSDTIANYCYLLCPEGMINEKDSPNWGILWYSEKTGRLRLIRKATRFEMTDKTKLGVMLHFFYSGINNVEKLTENFNL